MAKVVITLQDVKGNVKLTMKGVPAVIELKTKIDVARFDSMTKAQKLGFMLWTELFNWIKQVSR